MELFEVSFIIRILSNSLHCHWSTMALLWNRNALFSYYLQHCPR